MGPQIEREIIIGSLGGVFDAMIAEVTMLDTGSPDALQCACVAGCIGAR